MAARACGLTEAPRSAMAISSGSRALKFTPKAHPGRERPKVAMAPPIRIADTTPSIQARPVKVVSTLTTSQASPATAMLAMTPGAKASRLRPARMPRPGVATAVTPGMPGLRLNSGCGD